MIFKLEGKDSQSKARAGSITTDHGVIETPIFDLTLQKWIVKLQQIQ